MLLASPLLENAPKQSRALGTPNAAPTTTPYVPATVDGSVKMRNITNRKRVIRIRRKLKENRYLRGKRIYKREQLELTIPSKFRNVVEPFLGKDLQVQAKREGNNLIIEAKPMEKPP